MPHHTVCRPALLVLASAIVASTFVAPPASAGSAPAIGGVQLVSRSSSGAISNGTNSSSSISADGRYVAFESTARNLAPGPRLAPRNVFLRDRLGATTVLVSRTPTGGYPARVSTEPMVSEDGSTVVYETNATDIVPGAGAGILAFDIATGVNENVSDGISSASNPFVSADGRYVSFTISTGSGPSEVRVHDRTTGLTDVVSRTPTGGVPNAGSDFSSVSDSGRYVFFNSTASDLVAGDTNGGWDLFVYDREREVTARLTRGTTGNDGATVASISADERFVVYDSAADDLVGDDGNGWSDVFLYDVQARTTRLVSRTSGGAPGEGNSLWPDISADGRYITYSSNANDLGPGEADGFAFDVFVHDRTTGSTSMISRTRTGGPDNCLSSSSTISADARWVAYESCSSNLVRGDTNGQTDVFVHRWS